jgi:hypothetical protein
MKSRSNSDVASRPGSGTSFVRHEVVMAVLEERDFTRAQGSIEGLGRWSSFDEFMCERDGLHIGLSSAGLKVHLVAISMHDFEQWTLHSRVTPSLRSLDEFAKYIHLFRLTPELRVESCPTDHWKSKARDFDLGGGSFRVPIAPTLYSEWLTSLDSLEISFPKASIDVYAQILVESWSDVS